VRKLQAANIGWWAWLDWFVSQGQMDVSQGQVAAKHWHVSPNFGTLRAKNKNVRRSPLQLSTISPRQQQA